MKNTDNILHKNEFPLSNKYDQDFVLSNWMGPNPLWLLEWLSKDLDIRPGMTVLDLGCGRALTSIFLAKEFGAKVIAADLWVDPEDNWARICEAGVSDLVIPVKMEAHNIPFSAGFFDRIVSIDAYQYFGTDVMYLRFLSRFFKPGGKIGVIVPGLMKEITGGIPEHLTREQENGATFWEDDCAGFLTEDQWKSIWEVSNRVSGITIESQENGWKYWADFEEAVEAAGKHPFKSIAETLRRDQGEYLCLIKLAGSIRITDDPFNLYDPALVSKLRSMDSVEPK